MKNSKPLVDFGQTVVRLRLEAGLTQSDLAERCPKYKGQIAQIEAGAINPSLSMIFALAMALGVAPGTLVCSLPDADAGTPGPDA